MKRTNRKLLILDLDETLIHAAEEPSTSLESFRLGPYQACERPHVREFLRSMGERFELAVWSSASGPYVAVVVERLFGGFEGLAFVWSRERCTQRWCPETYEHYWRKHLKKVKRLGYDLSQVVAVDDTPRKWEQSYGNLVTVRPFTGEAEDEELLLLGRYLETLAGVEDVRREEKRGWRARLLMADGGDTWPHGHPERCATGERQSEEDHLDQQRQGDVLRQDAGWPGSGG